MDHDSHWVFEEPDEVYRKLNGGQENPIVEKTFAFALRIITFTKVLRDAGWYDLARQLFRAGTSVGAHVNEGQHPESRADFIHKMKGALKEDAESIYWLRLCKVSPLLPYEDGMLENALEIKAILSKIIFTAVKNA